MFAPVSLVSLVLLGIYTKQVFSKDSNAVYLQGFNWDAINYSPRKATLYNHLEDISDSMKGYIDGVWLPPASQSADKAGYMPGKWYDIIDGDVLKRLIQTFKSKGIISIADIVVNHRTGNQVDGCTGYYSTFQSPDWGNWAVVQNDHQCDSKRPICEYPCGCASSADSGENFCAAPDIDHTNPRIQNDIIQWMNWLKKEYGYQGFRFDMVKGFAPEFVKKYVAETGHMFSVGEFYDGDIGKVASWSNQANTSAFDFPLRYSLNHAVHSDNFSGLKLGIHSAGLLGRNKAMAVTFLENHDTGRYESAFGSNNQDKISMGYAYILTHPGIPFVYYDHWVHNQYLQDKIKSLIRVRKEYNISSMSELYIENTEYGLYTAYIGQKREKVEKCGGSVAVKIGSNRSWSPCGNGWKVAVAGNSWAVWTRKA